jgi:hypothetical protein
LQNSSICTRYAASAESKTCQPSEAEVSGEFSPSTLVRRRVRLGGKVSGYNRAGVTVLLTISSKRKQKPKSSCEILAELAQSEDSLLSAACGRGSGRRRYQFSLDKHGVS